MPSIIPLFFYLGHNLATHEQFFTRTHTQTKCCKQDCNIGAEIITETLHEYLLGLTNCRVFAQRNWFRLLSKMRYSINQVKKKKTDTSSKTKIDRNLQEHKGGNILFLLVPNKVTSQYVSDSRGQNYIQMIMYCTECLQMYKCT